MVQECQGQPLPCYVWTCDDRRQQILVSGVCNARPDCDDKSDEKSEICEGFTQRFFVAVALCIGAYAFTGTFLMLLGFKLKRKTSPNVDSSSSSSSQSQTAAATNSIEMDRNCQLDSIMDLRRLMLSRENDNDSDYEDIIKVHKDQGTVPSLICIIRYAEEDIPSERRNVFVDTMFRLEIRDQSGDESRAFAELRRLCDDDKLFGWTVGVLQRGFGDKAKEFLQRKFLELKTKFPLLNRETDDKDSNALVDMLKRALKIISISKTLISFYFDLFKDVIGYFILDHISDEILQHNFSEIGGINLDWIKYYMLASAALSQIGLFISSLVYSKELRGGLNSRTLRVLSFIFPLHFALVEEGYLAFTEAGIEKKLQEESLELLRHQSITEEGGDNDSEGRNKLASLARSQFSSVKLLLVLRRRMKEMRKEYCKMQLIETIVELMPQFVVQLVLFEAGKRYGRLRRFFEDVEGNWAGVTADQMFTFSIATTFFGIVSNFGNWKNKARYPLTPPPLGTVLQMTSVAALVLPKIYFVAACLNHQPDFYAVTQILEILLLIGYTKLVFREPITMEVIPSMICPAHLNSERNDDIFKDSQWRRFLSASARVPSSLLLSFLVLLIIYLPTGLVLRIKLYAVYEQPTGIQDSLKDLGAGVYVYMAGLVLYVMSTLLYYQIGHNWKMNIHNMVRPASKPAIDSHNQANVET